MPRQDGRPCPVKIADITIDPRLEVRADGTDAEHVERLTEAVKARGGKKPPRVKVRVVEDPPGRPKGTYSFAIDGKHTLAAYAAAGKKVVPCLSKRSTWEEAVTDAAMSNQGPRALPMSRRDKARAIEMLLQVHGDDCEEPWSNGMIAKSLGVSDEMVRTRRPAGAVPLTGTARKGTDGRMQPARKKIPREPDEKNKDTRKLHIGTLKVSEEVARLFRLSHIQTLGDLADVLARGGLPGLRDGDRRDLMNELSEYGVPAKNDAKPPGVRDDPEPKKPGDPLFDWRKYDLHYGVVARGPDALKARYPSTEVRDRADALTRLLTEFRSAWDELRELCVQSQEGSDEK